MKRGAETEVPAPPVARSAAKAAQGGSGRRAQNLLAFLPVAGAELVRLKRVEDPQGLLRVAADVEAVHRDVLDDVVGIDDEGGPEGDALVPGNDPERVRQLLLVVRQPREVG